jgi:hypothetical protein
MFSHASAALLIERAIPAGLRLRLCFGWLRIGPHRILAQLPFCRVRILK